MGSKWSRKFFSFLKLNYKQKPFERTLLGLLGTKYGCSAPFWSETSFSKNRKNRSQMFFFLIILWKKTFWYRFFEKLVSLQKGAEQPYFVPRSSNRVCSKGFCLQFNFKKEKNFATIFNPSNPPLFKAQKHVFSRNPILAPYHLSEQPSAT